MKKRLKFLCWNCDREYSMTCELDGKPQLIVACPFCGKEATVDLDKDRKPISIYKGLDNDSAQTEVFNFPPVIPTFPPTS